VPGGLDHLPSACHNAIHLIVGFITPMVTVVYISVSGAVTGCPATGTLWRPVDISSGSESCERATALNGVLRATTDRKFLPQTPRLLHSAAGILRHRRHRCGGLVSLPGRLLVGA
jgi:hypothetical protein